MPSMGMSIRFGFHRQHFLSRVTASLHPGDSVNQGRSWVVQRGRCLHTWFPINARQTWWNESPAQHADLRSCWLKIPWLCLHHFPVLFSDPHFWLSTWIKRHPAVKCYRTSVLCCWSIVLIVLYSSEQTNLGMWVWMDFDLSFKTSKVKFGEKKLQKKMLQRDPLNWIPCCRMKTTLETISYFLDNFVE